MAVALGAAAVAGGASYLASREQKKATDAANQGNIAAQKQAQEQLTAFAGKADTSAKAGIKAAEQGFSEAQEAVGRLGHVARARVTQRETARKGQADAALANRGLYSSTRAVNVQNAIGAETDLTLAGIDESVANLRSQIFRERARVVGQFNMARASLFGQFANLGSSVALANQHVAANVGGAIGAAGGSLAQILMQLRAA